MSTQVYSTDVELWQQEILAVIGYDITIMSMCDDFGAQESCINRSNRKWQDYVYIQCEYKSTKQKIKHLLREENKVKENKIS